MNNDSEYYPSDNEKIAAWKVTTGVIAVSGILWAAIIGGCFFCDWLAHYVMDAITHVKP